MGKGSSTTRSTCTRKGVLPMISRPPIERITYISAEGNPHPYQVGMGCTEIREVEENGEYCLIPWAEVWDGDQLLARFNQHKLEHIIYKKESSQCLNK